MSYIYIIGTNQPPYKIGITINPEQRLRSLQTGFPYPLKILYLEKCLINEYKQLEKEIHNTLSYKRTKGEWFNLDLDQAIHEIKFVIIRFSKS